ncbi:hypothetical protein [Micromonospora coerulea]|nr:hypothetical protein [Micromonospora veneta]
MTPAAGLADSVRQLRADLAAVRRDLDAALTRLRDARALLSGVTR